MKGKLILLYIFIAFVIFESSSVIAQSENEVWYCGDGLFGIGRVALDGTPLPTINTDRYVEGLEVVGDEVWWSGDVLHGFGRFATDGTPLSNFNVGRQVVGFSQVENEVWYGADGLFGIGRISLDGNLLPDISTSRYVWDVCMVPEPTTLSLFVLGTIALIKRNRRK